MHRAKLLAAAAVVMSLWAPCGASAATNILYETFAGIEIVALSAANPNSGIALHSGNATNVVAGGGRVYWEDGLNIWAANPDLTVASIVHTNGVAPAGLGLDVQDGILYETFAGIEIVALSAANPNSGIALHSGNATNVVAGGGRVYWEDGLNIWAANPDLTGASIVHTNGVAPTGLGLDVQDGILYETFAGIEIVAVSAANPNSGIALHSGNATNVVAGGGRVYWEDGLNIWAANPDLTGASIVHTNGVAPAGLGLYVFPTPVAPGPVPGTGLVSLAFLALAGSAAEARGLLQR